MKFQILSLCLALTLQTSYALKCHQCQPSASNSCGDGPDSDLAAECTPENSFPGTIVKDYLKGLIPFSVQNNLLNITTKTSPKPITFAKQSKVPLPDYLCYKLWGEAEVNGDKASSGMHGCISKAALGSMNVTDVFSLDFCANGEIDDKDGDMKAKGSICLCNDDVCNGANSMVAATGLLVLVSIFGLNKLFVQ